MKIIRFYLPFLLSLAISGKILSQDTIHWSSDYKLKWKDFQGIPNINSDVKAISSLQIEYSIASNDSNSFWQVAVFFEKSTSWALGKSKNLLAHEQGHFDIAELYARKIAKAFTKARKVEELDTIFEILMAEYEITTKLYDKETNFSIDVEKQKNWSNKIKTKLKELYSYRGKRGYVKK